MSALSGEYSIVVRCSWPDRDPILVLIEEIPNDQSPKQIYALLRDRFILGRDRVAFRELEAGMHPILGVGKRKTERWPKWTEKRIDG